jgi:hypothetical protein
LLSSASCCGTAMSSWRFSLAAVPRRLLHAVAALRSRRAVTARRVNCSGAKVKPSCVVDAIAAAVCYFSNLKSLLSASGHQQWHYHRQWDFRIGKVRYPLKFLVSPHSTERHASTVPTLLPDPRKLSRQHGPIGLRRQPAPCAEPRRRRAAPDAHKLGHVAVQLPIGRDIFCAA